MSESGVRTYEADIRFQDQFLMSRSVHGSVSIRGVPRQGKHVDLVLYDLKQMESSRHQEVTGLSNELVLKNARLVSQLGVPMVVHPANFRILAAGLSPTAILAQMNSINSAAAVEIENGKAATEILGGVLTKFPDLKALIPTMAAECPCGSAG
jgi:hypothetical protein